LETDDLSTKDRIELEELKAEGSGDMEKELSDLEKEQLELDSEKEQNKIDKHEATREEREQQRKQKLDQIKYGLPSSGMERISGGSQDAVDREQYHETVTKPNQ
jgi:acetyl-CoA carboxylase alpha subunit